MFSGAVFIESFLQSVQSFEGEENIGKIWRKCIDAFDDPSNWVSVSESKDGDCEKVVFAELQEFSAEGFPAHI